ncbi:MAG: Abi family protein [Metamycoplasmataceae bacterium]
MYKDNDKIMIGNIDCTTYQEKFKVRSITRYKKLYEILKSKGYEVSDFNDLNHIFNRDIRIKLEVLKHLFYIENRLAAEIVNFLQDSEESFIDLVWGANEFKKTNDDWLNDKILKMNGEILNIRRYHQFIDLTTLADFLTFGSKIHLSEILRNCIKLHNSNKELKLSFELSELKMFKRFRNKISHNEFIYDENKEIVMKLFNSLEKYITKDFTDKFNEFYKYVDEHFI